MNVYLTYELEVFIKAKVQSSRYGSATEVIHDALRALKDEDERDERPEAGAAAIMPFDRDRDVEFFRTL